MTEYEFTTFMKKIHFVFGRIMPKTDRLDFLFEELKFVPQEAISYILDKFKTEQASLPTNLIKQVKSYWYEYLRDNPRKRELGNCNNYYCDSGFIWCEGLFGEKNYQFVSLCPDCRAGASLESLRDKGYMIIDLKSRNKNVKVGKEQKERVMSLM